jgi:MFS family permease
LTSASSERRIEAFLSELNCGEQIRILYRRYGLWYGWAAMFTIVLANVAALMTGTIINVAIPDIMGAFGIGQDKAQWLATAFLASSTVTMLLNSWLIQTYGVRATVIGAMSIFMAGSVLGGISPTTDLLIAARILQGAATGVITPMGMSRGSIPLRGNNGVSVAPGASTRTSTSVCSNSPHSPSPKECTKALVAA